MYHFKTDPNSTLTYNSRGTLATPNLHIKIWAEAAIVINTVVKIHRIFMKSDYCAYENHFFNFFIFQCNILSVFLSWEIWVDCTVILKLHLGTMLSFTGWPALCSSYLSLTDIFQAKFVKSSSSISSYLRQLKVICIKDRNKTKKTLS